MPAREHVWDRYHTVGCHQCPNGHWHADRPAPAARLWAAIRGAA